MGAGDGRGAGERDLTNMRGGEPAASAGADPRNLEKNDEIGGILYNFCGGCADRLGRRTARMPKHRGLILEHQTSRPGSLNDIFRTMPKIAPNSPGVSTVRQEQPSTAMVDLGLELGNERFLSQEAAWGEAIFW